LASKKIQLPIPDPNAPPCGDWLSMVMLVIGTGNTQTSESTTDSQSPRRTEHRASGWRKGIARPESIGYTGHPRVIGFIFLSRDGDREFFSGHPKCFGLHLGPRRVFTLHPGKGKVSSCIGFL